VLPAPKRPLGIKKKRRETKTFTREPNPVAYAFGLKQSGGGSVEARVRGEGVITRGIPGDSNDASSRLERHVGEGEGLTGS